MESMPKAVVNAAIVERCTTLSCCTARLYTATPSSLAPPGAKRVYTQASHFDHEVVALEGLLN